MLVLPPNDNNGNSWSDRQLAAAELGQSLTAISIKKNSDDSFIVSIRARSDIFNPYFYFRYGETWAEKHSVNGNSDDGGEETLELSESESIRSIVGYSRDHSGSSNSLLAETS